MQGITIILDLSYLAWRQSAFETKILQSLGFQSGYIRPTPPEYLYGESSKGDWLIEIVAGAEKLNG